MEETKRAERVNVPVTNLFQGVNYATGEDMTVVTYYGFSPKDGHYVTVKEKEVLLPHGTKFYAKE